MIWRIIVICLLMAIYLATLGYVASKSRAMKKVVHAIKQKLPERKKKEKPIKTVEAVETQEKEQKEQSEKGVLKAKIKEFFIKICRALEIAFYTVAKAIAKVIKVIKLSRFLLIALVLLLGVVLLTYFLGGYKSVGISYNTRDFSTEGFLSYDEFSVLAEEEARALPYEATDSFEQKVEKCNYISQLQTVIGEMTNVINSTTDSEEKARLESLRNRANEIISRRELPSEGAYVRDYVRTYLGYGEEPVMENGSYEFWFNKQYTTFKIVEKRTGNTWYSNPADKDDYTNNPSTLRQQQSLLNIYYAGLLGATTMWDSYTYSISNTDIGGEEQLTPTFKIKFVEDTNGKNTAVQVYYHFGARGINYAYFPKTISKTRLSELSDININDDEQLPELVLRNKNITTDGVWEKVAATGAAAEGTAIYASDNTIWYTGISEPDPELGVDGNYYINIGSNELYVKSLEDEWQLMNTDLLNWVSYYESNLTYNVINEVKQVFKNGYTGDGAPVETDGLNGFYYFDYMTGDVYKKSNGTLSYEYVLAGKEVALMMTQIYSIIPLGDGNKFGYLYYNYSGTHSAMKLQERKRLYAYLYQKCLYSEEDLIADNEEFSNETILDKAQFEVAIEYTLNEKGFVATLLDESIVELKEYPLTTIEILPYFGAAHSSTDGYMVIPDGSGAVMNYNNGKTSYTQYSKMVYSTDLSKIEEVKTTTTEDLMFAMYAMINENIVGNDGVKSGLLVDALEGAAQLHLSANISKITDSYNKIFYSSFYRESQKVAIGTGYYTKTHTKWTENRTHSDVVLQYNFLKEDELSYSAVALKYREILAERYGLENNDETTSNVINVNLVGAYDYRNTFLGIGYKDYASMTTFAQAEEILKQLKSTNSGHINAYYLGWRSKGLIDTTFDKIKLSKELGNKKNLAELVEYTKNSDIDLYMNIDMGEVNKYQEAYGNSRYTTRDVSGSYVEKYPYDLAINMYDKKQLPIYVVSPRYYLSFAESIVNNYSKVTGLNNIAIETLGSALAGDYKRHSEFFKELALDEHEKTLQYLTNNGIEKITLYTPYDFAFKYTKNALEVPYTSTLLEVLDYSIPFYQLVVNGLFDYSGEVINANDEKGNDWHIMHILETGSNTAFTFSYEDSSELIQTDYKYYYYTQYTKWLADVNNIVGIINSIGIHNYQLTDHSLVGLNTYKVTYSNAQGKLEILLNYSDAIVNVNGIEVDAKSYMYNNGSGWRD